METKYIVSALKYRPDSFASMVGQEALSATLKSSIVQQKTAHAYLFCGPRGVGKTSCARIFARAINCLERLPDGEACGRCESCKAFDEQRSMNIYELDAASNNSVDDIRLLIEQANVPPQIGKYKIYIIDEVHMLSQQAFNAFLKTLEEPPSYVIFILATTEKHKILPTILSRCQIFDFKRIPPARIEQHLRYVADSEGIKAEAEALAIIATKADGGMRDALSLFDRIARFSEGNITYANTIENLNILDYDYYFRLTDFFLQGDYRSVLIVLDELLAKGFDGQVIVSGLASFFRDLMMAQDASTLPLLEQSEVVIQRYVDMATRCPTSFLYQSLKILNACDQQYRQSNGKRLLLELSLMNIAALFSKGLTAPPPTHGAQHANPVVSGSASPGPAPAKEQPSVAPSQSSVPPQPSIGEQRRQPETTAPTITKDKPEQTKVVPPTRPMATSTVGSEGRFTLRGIRNKQEQLQNNIQEVRTEMTESFDEEQLQLAWIEFAETKLSEEIHLKETMANCLPKLRPGTSAFEVEVLNSRQEEEINNVSARLLGFLADKLCNTTIRMNVRVSESTSLNRVPVSLDEKIERLNQENPLFDELRMRLGLSLV